MILYYKLYGQNCVILPLSADMAASADIASADIASADMAPTVITASTTNAAATTAADLKKTLEELHADIKVSKTSRHFLSEVCRLVKKLGYEKFLCIYAQEPWGFPKVLREVAEGFQAGTFVPPPVLREGKATLPRGNPVEYVLEAIFRPDSREYISNPLLGGLMPPPSNKHMGVLPKFVNDCLSKGKEISTAMFASLYWFLKREYGSDAAHEAFTVRWDNVGNEKKSPIEDLTQDCPIALLLSGNFPDTLEKVDSLFEALVKQLNSRTTPQDDYRDEKIALLTHIKKYYDARKNSFLTEDEGFNQTFLELLASLMTTFEIFARCENNYIGCWVSYFDANIASHKDKFVATNDKLCRQMDDLRSRIILLFEDESSMGTVKHFVPPQYPSSMEG